jgi:nucleoside-diphosphate-sugar epimerase
VTRSLALVTGGGGALGRRVTADLQKRGWHVRALVHTAAAPHADESVSGDLLDPESLLTATRGADAVVHLAALTHARRERAYRVANVDGTRNLLDAATRAGSGRFVYVSTRTASATGGGYAESKLEAERLVQASGVEHVIVRLPEIVGLGAGEGVDDIVDRARRGAAIPVIGEGSQIICPAPADDVVRAIGAALTEPAAAGKRYVLAGDCMSVRAFAELCVEQSGSNSRIVQVPTAVVQLAARAARVLPLPLFPDQLARLRARNDPATAEAETDLGFSASPIGPVLERLISS